MLPILQHLQEENRELRRALAIMWHAWDTDNRPPRDVLALAKRCFEEGRRSNRD